MSHCNLSRLIGLFLGLALSWVTSTVHADQAAGDACADKLKPDGKLIYTSAMALKPTPNAVAATVETAARDLGQNRRISGGVTARDNAAAAAACVRTALQ